MFQGKVKTEWLTKGALSPTYIPRSGITGSYGRSMFSFLRRLKIVFQSGCTSLHLPQQFPTRVSFPPHPCQHLLLLVFLMMAFLTGVRWNLSVFMICISFMARNGEHFLAIWIPYFEKVLFSSVAHFFIGSLILREFSFLSSLYILVIRPLSDL
jgi:hypothetical protein